MSSRAHVLIRFLSLVVFAASSVYIISTFSLSFDLSARDLHSLSPGTDRVLDLVVDHGKPILIYAYVSPDLPPNHERNYKKLLALLEHLSRFGDSNPVTVNAVSSDGEIIEKDVSSLLVQVISTTPLSSQSEDANRSGVRPVSIRESIGGRSITRSIFMGLSIRAAGNQRTIPFLSSMKSIEYQIMESIRSAITVDPRYAQNVSRAVFTPRRIAVLEREPRITGGFDSSGSMTSLPAWGIVSQLRQSYKVDRVNEKDIIKFIDNHVRFTEEEQANGRASAIASFGEPIDLLLVPMLSSLTQVEMDAAHRYISAGLPALILDDPLFNPLSIRPRQVSAGQWPQNSQVRYSAAAPRFQGNPFARSSQPPVEEKGDFRKFYRSFGIAFSEYPGSNGAGKKIVWTYFDRYPSLHDLVPRDVAMISRDDGDILDAVIGEDDPNLLDRPAVGHRRFDFSTSGIRSHKITEGIDEILLLGAGTIKPISAADTAYISPLLTTNAMAGEISFDSFSEGSDNPFAQIMGQAYSRPGPREYRRWDDPFVEFLGETSFSYLLRIIARNLSEDEFTESPDIDDVRSSLIHLANRYQDYHNFALVPVLPSVDLEGDLSEIKSVPQVIASSLADYPMDGLADNVVESISLSELIPIIQEIAQRIRGRSVSLEDRKMLQALRKGDLSFATTGSSSGLKESVIDLAKKEIRKRIIRVPDILRQLNWDQGHIIAAHIAYPISSDSSKLEDGSDNSITKSGIKTNFAFIADLDFISDTLFGISSTDSDGDGQSDFRFRNVEFVNNMVDYLVGDESMISLRAKYQRPRPLLALESKRRVFAEARHRSERASVEEFQKQDRDARDFLNQKLQDIQERRCAGSTEIQCLQLMAKAQRLEQIKLDQSVSKLSREMDRKQHEYRNTEIRQELDIQNTIRLWAVLPAPLVFLALGVVLFILSMRREQSTAHSSRRRKKGCDEFGESS